MSLVIGGSIAGVWAALAAQSDRRKRHRRREGVLSKHGGCVVAANGGGDIISIPGNEEQRAGILSSRFPEDRGSR